MSENGQATPEARSRRAMKRVRYKANQRQNEARIYGVYESLGNWNSESNLNQSLNRKSNAKLINKSSKIKEAAPGLLPQWLESDYQ